MTSTFDVLAEPQRRRILDLLRERERPVGELVDRLSLGQPGVSKHLRILRDAGLGAVDWTPSNTISTNGRSHDGRDPRAPRRPPADPLRAPACSSGRARLARAHEFDTDIRGRLRWELEPAGDGTVLTFSAQVDLPDEYESEVIAGWHIHLDHLEHVLDGGTVDWPNWDREHRPDWERIHERYKARV